MHRLAFHEPLVCWPMQCPAERPGIAAALFGTVLFLLSAALQAAQPPLSLREAFAAAWERQPEARSIAAREDAARARRDIAAGWTAEAMAVEFASKSDRLNRNDGSREHELGLVIPLWLPGERSGTRALADAEVTGIASRAAVAQLRTSAMVREAYWAWERARVDVALARDRLENAQSLAADVARRHRAGDLARSDQHQADGNAAAAQGALADAENILGTAAQALRALVGRAVFVSPAPVDTKDYAPQQFAEPMPGLPSDAGAFDAKHPAVVDLLAQAEVAKRALELARAQTRGSPELLVATTRERAAFGESYAQSLTLGVRIPLGSDARHRAKVAQASAEAIELESQLQLERERVLAGLDAARQKVDALRLQLDAARRRALLAAETRGFFEKSFRAGETDLPTRLRIELESTEAERQAARTAVEHASSISALRQALGLLP